MSILCRVTFSCCVLIVTLRQVTSGRVVTLSQAHSKSGQVRSPCYIKSSPQHVRSGQVVLFH